MTDAVAKALKDAQRSLQILDVVSRSVSSRLAMHLDGLAIPEEMAMQMRFSVARHLRRETLEAESGAEVPIVEFTVLAGARFVNPAAVEKAIEPDEADVFASVEVEFGALYRLLGECDDECLRAFGEKNVPIQVWPYWREMLHSQTSRMRLTPVVLGLWQPNAFEPTLPHTARARPLESKSS